MTSLGQTASSVRARGTATAAHSSEHADSVSYTRPSSLPQSRVSSLPYTGKLDKSEGTRYGGMLWPGSSSSSTGGISRVEWRLLAVVVVIAFVVRMYKIGQPSSVV